MSSNALEMLERGIAERAFPRASAAVGDGDRILFRADVVSGSITPAAEVVLYDLASLTKTMSTAVLALLLIDRGTLALEAPIARYIDVPRDKQAITILDLLRHTAGFEAYFFLSDVADDSADVVSTILERPLAYETGSSVIYSCIGYILLGKIIEALTGDSLDGLARRLIFEPSALDQTGYRPLRWAAGAGLNIAPTEWDAETEAFLCGVVHDENARFLDGVSGNAGLFSSVDDCARFGAMLLRKGDGLLPPELFDLMVRNWTEGLDESRGLGVSLWNGQEGWQGGTGLGNGAFGHTGFTGTSIYVSPALGLYFVLLTNRVHYGRDLAAMPRYRSMFHDAVISDLR